jgi:hypothetical protein
MRLGPLTTAHSGCAASAATTSPTAAGARQPYGPSIRSRVTGKRVTASGGVVVRDGPGKQCNDVTVQNHPVHHRPFLLALALLHGSLHPRSRVLLSTRWAEREIKRRRGNYTGTERRAFSSLVDHDL